MRKTTIPGFPVQRPPLIDALFEPYRQTLGSDFDGYRNHSIRVFNFCRALSGNHPDDEGKIALAAVFHDLGIWTDMTFDYLPHSRRLARAWLEKNGRDAWIDEIDRIIEQHHKITAFNANPAWLVEPFRKADLVDLSGGLVRFRLDDEFVREVLEEFPNAGFHKTLLRLSIQRMKSHPCNPLPMMKW
ncbi:MAG: HD domain-containing protein [Chlorobiaceae bacterium]|nr:HD domain-containing protein [Chlorobiaceae bacterium]